MLLMLGQCLGQCLIPGRCILRGRCSFVFALSCNNAPRLLLLLLPLLPLLQQQQVPLSIPVKTFVKNWGEILKDTGIGCISQAGVGGSFLTAKARV